MNTIAIELDTTEIDVLYDALEAAHMERINQMAPADDVRLLTLARLIELVEAETVESMIQQEQQADENLKPFVDAYEAHQSDVWCCPDCGHDDFELVDSYSDERRYECTDCGTAFITEITETVIAVDRRSDDNGANQTQGDTK